MGELVAILTPILWHTVRAAWLDTATAEDVLQNTWLTPVRKADSIAEPLAVLQWLVVTTKEVPHGLAKFALHSLGRITHRRHVPSCILKAVLHPHARRQRHRQEAPARCLGREHHQPGTRPTLA